MNSLKEIMKSYSILKVMDNGNTKSFLTTMIKSTLHGIPSLEEKILGIYDAYFKTDLEQYVDMTFSQNEEGSNTIWLCWWQGVNHMPSLIKNCYERLKALNPDSNIIVLTKENYSSYVSIDERIIKLVEEEKITITLFSDILRATILYENGGLWVDASTYFTKPLPTNMLKDDFISTRLDINSQVAKENFISEARWTSFFMGSRCKHTTIFLVLKEFMTKLVIEFQYIPYYFSMDLILRLTYDNVLSCKREIDKLTITSPDIHKFASLWNREFNKDEFEKLYRNNLLFKLNNKWHSDKKTNSYEFFFNQPRSVTYHSN